MQERIPKVSAVISTFNRADLVGRAIESVINQTYRNMEIIVVDDHSTDNTAEVVKQFGESRVHYIRHERNKGGSAARNTGIKAATGEYIAFLDDDDEWVENKIERQLQYMQDFGGVVCRSFIPSLNRMTQLYKKDTVNPRDLRKGFIFGGGTSILLARADILKDTLFDENLASSQDWDLLVRLASKCKVAYIKEPLVRFNVGSHARITNKSKHMSIAQLEERLGAVYKHEEFLGPYWFKYQLARRLLNYIRYKNDPQLHLVDAIKRCGVLPVLAVIAKKIYRNVAYPNDPKT
jgi:glycosyltransferase involved in cell wall biosynthesis